ncbi:MAG: HlyD family secretion protein [Bryobacteraceae bacterium]
MRAICRVSRPLVYAMKRLMIALVLAAVIAGLGFALFGWLDGRRIPEAAGLLRAIVSGRNALAGEGARLQGIVVAREAVVAATVAGRISKLKVDEGDLVKTGEPIVALEREETEAENANERAKVAQLMARLSQVQEQHRLEVDRYGNQLARATAQLQAAESEHHRAGAELDHYRAEAARAHDLAGAGLLAKSELERSDTNVRVAEARLRALADQVESARADLEVCRSNKRQLTVAAQEVEQTKAQLDQARAQLRQADTRLGYTSIQAPLSGVVSLRVAAQGEVVKAGDPIVNIVDLDDIWVKVNFEESYLANVTRGQKVRVVLVSGQEVVGEVINIFPEGEFATQRDVSRIRRDIRTFGVKVRIPNPDHRIQPGMTAYVYLRDTSAGPGGEKDRNRAPPGAGRKPEAPRSHRE